MERGRNGKNNNKKGVEFLLLFSAEDKSNFRTIKVSPPLLETCISIYYTHTFFSSPTCLENPSRFAV